MLPTIATGNVASALAGEYEVANSLRFNSGSSDYLTVANPTAGNRKTGTLSFWIKICKLSTHYIYNTYNSSASGYSSAYIQITSAGRIEFINYQASGGNHSQVSTNRLFRDFSAWYHFVVAWDTTQSTASDRVKIYVNGTQETSLSNTDYPGSNEDLFFDIGGTSNPRLINYAFSNYGDNYLAEMVYVNGTALDPTSFGEFDEDTSIWKPKDVSGLTFGNEGFYLDFENSGSLGADVSGNSNNFTVNNLTSVDQSTDTCTNNFATMNPLNIPTSNPPIFSEGNLQVSSSTTGSGDFGGSSTIGVSSGKWFVETKVIDGNQSAGQGNAIGISGEASKVLPPSHGTATNSSYAYKANGDKVVNGSASSYGATFTQNDIIGIALDLDSSPNTVTFYKNGASQGAINIVSSSSTTDGFYFFIQGDTSTSNNTPSILSYNFGSPAFSISSGNSDANGHGNFEYAVPSGYYALNTKNLAEYG